MLPVAWDPKVVVTLIQSIGAPFNSASTFKSPQSGKGCSRLTVFVNSLKKKEVVSPINSWIVVGINAGIRTVLGQLFSSGLTTVSVQVPEVTPIGVFAMFGRFPVPIMIKL